MMNLSSTPPGKVTKEGNILIVSRGALLPPFCIKCGIPTQSEKVERTMVWCPAYVPIFVILGGILGIALYFLYQEGNEACAPALRGSSGAEGGINLRVGDGHGGLRTCCNDVGICHWLGVFSWQ